MNPKRRQWLFSTMERASVMVLPPELDDVQQRRLETMHHYRGTGTATPKPTGSDDSAPSPVVLVFFLLGTLLFGALAFYLPLLLQK